MEEIREIQDRLAACFAGGRRLVFWQDAGGEYQPLVADLCVDGTTVIDATGRELETKRRILRIEPDANFVIYRTGEAPECTEDFLYDLKLAAVPFTCSMEGIWADECGIDPSLAPMLSEHERFFASKQRKASLAASELPKKTAEDLRFAMLAAAFKVQDDSRRDAVRSIVAKALVEHAKADEATMRLVAESGLAATFWSAVRSVLDYEAIDGEQPSVADLSFRMLVTACAGLIEGGPAPLSNDAVRILDSLQSSAQTCFAFEHVASKGAEGIRALVPDERRTVEDLRGFDAIPAFDEWILSSFAADARAGGLSLPTVESVYSERRYMAWASRYELHYQTLLALAKLDAALSTYKSQVSSATTLKAIFDGYCSAWHEVDAQYRRFNVLMRELGNGRFRQSLSEACSETSARYDAFLVDLTDRWQLHLMDEGAWPPACVPAQSAFFREKVELGFPKAERGRRIGVIISDALRYEAGAELASRLNASARSGLRGKARAVCEGMACMLPSYTQLGMAALLPDGAMRIDPATQAVFKENQPTCGLENRGKHISKRVDGAIALKAAKVLEEGLGDVSGAPAVFVFHNVIDKIGDSRESESKVFEAVDTAFAEIEVLAEEFVRAGCGTVVVTSDHGFLYQAHDLQPHDFADVPDLGRLSATNAVDTDHTRRFVVGEALPKDDVLIEYAAADLSLEGDYRIALPKGITRLRLSGSGARYVHGGASLQENVIPVVTLKVVAAKEASRPAEIECYAIGRTAITGPSVSVNVRQVEPCSDVVLPVTVRLGVYSAEGRLLSVEEKALEFDSVSQSADERTRRITVNLTDDVDLYQSVWVRVSRRISGTNSFGKAWEKEYSVNRAFGMDF